MSLKNKLRFSALASVLATPIIALPLVNAVKSGVEPEDIPSNIPDREIEIGKDSFYTVKFHTERSHPEWGMHATITRIYVAYNVYIEKVQFPQFIEASDGHQYELRTIQCKGKDLGAGEIKCLDFSKAKGLKYIHAWSFNQRNGLKIRSVNFNGAASLERIEEGAFSNQWFRNDSMKVLDFTGTSLNFIGEDAFFACADDNHNVFDAVIFPPTMKKIDKNAFSSKNEKTRIRFKKVIFTDPNPPKDLFVDGIPRVADTSGKDIVVPYGALNRYRDLPHFDRTYAKNLYESKILYMEPTGDDHSTRGSVRITTPEGVAGVDQYDWNPVDDTKYKFKNCYLWLINPNDYDISLDEQGHLNWGSNLTPGYYHVKVCAVKFDDQEGKLLSCAMSDTITISVIKPILIGGTEHIAVRPGAAEGQDSRQWKVAFDPAGSPSPVKTVKWNIPYKSERISNTVDIVDETQKEATVKWNQIPEAEEYIGTHSFILCAEVQDNWAENTYKVYKQVYFSIGDYTTMEVQYSTDGGTNWQPYDGQEIKLEQSGKVDFKLITSMIPSGYDIGTPQLSIEGIETTKDAENNYTFTFYAANRTPGLYHFTAHSLLTHQTSYNKINIYSANDIKVSVAQPDTTMISDIPGEIDIVKTTPGSYSYKVLKQPGWKVTDVVANPAKWHYYDRRIDDTISFAVDPNDDKSIEVTWSQKYSPVGDPFDDLDVMLDITISNTTTNETKLVHQSVSILATNTSEIDYEGESTKINACPGQRTTSETFTFKLNGAIAGYNNATWKCICENPTLQSCISMQPINDLTSDYAKLVIDLTSKSIPVGVYDVTVYAADDVDMTACFKTIQVNVNYVLSIIDAPTNIKTLVGTAGKTEKALITKLGDKSLSNPTYKIVGLGDRVFVDKEGYVNWKGNIPAGSYNLCLTSEIKIDGIVHSTSVYFTMDVSEPEKSNTGAIIGGSVGGAVVVAGATTGITLGVKKHKLPKGKKK